MSRSKGQSFVALAARDDLETVLAALSDHDECASRVEIRIRQAIRRAGLDGLLDPALDDLVRMTKDVSDAKSQVNVVIGKWMGR